MINFQFSHNDPNVSDRLLQTEWLETNGLGGWASSTIPGCNTRRYHGLLISAINPPTDRFALVAKLDETIVIGDMVYDLSMNDYGDVIYPNGQQYLRSFTKHLFPQFIYEAGGVRIRKSILMVHGENTTVIKYEVLTSPSEFALKFRPLFSARGYHQLMKSNENVQPVAPFENGELKWQVYEGTPEISLQLPGSSFHAEPQWYYGFRYRVEKYRGLDSEEDLFTPGELVVNAREGNAYYLTLSTERKGRRNAILLFESEVERREGLIRGEHNDFVQQLILAADQFIVRKDADLNTVIAGYHWFTDWGRDTMISLPGLCLATRRFEDARKILAAFAKSVDRGMLPNRFVDNGGAPEYNNVDGTLWYFIAVYRYLKATRDKEFVFGELLPVLKQIIDWHYRGTRYNIYVAGDALLHAGEAGVQLTWMDAKVGDWVVTPRTGKPVEVQALWYNAVCIFSELLQLNGQHDDAKNMLEEGARLKQAFTDKFWHEEGGYLADVISGDEKPDLSFRPNQLLAISLPFQLLEGEKARSVVRMVEEKLYTPRGLRSLSPDHPDYTGHYGGDAWHRDAAYHQGTVWSWLLGPYIDALFRTNGSSAALTKARKVVNDFLPHLSEAGSGTVSEIFDGAPPFTPRGCIAQAWGVAEMLRVVKTYSLAENSRPLPAVHGTK